MTRDDLKKLGRWIKLAALFRVARLNEPTMRAMIAGHPRELTPAESTALDAALREVHAEIDRVLNPTESA